MISSQLLLGKKRETDQGKARSSGLYTWIGSVPSTDTLPDVAQNHFWLSSLVGGPGAKGRRLPASESITCSEKFIRERS